MGSSKYSTVFCILLFFVLQSYSTFSCEIPIVLRGSWFSIENNENTLTEISDDSLTIKQKGREDKHFCVDTLKEHNAQYSLVFNKKTCYNCLKIFVRTNNIIEIIQGDCVNIPDSEASIEKVCKNVINQNKPLITLFKDNHHRVSCKNSIQGAYKFAYQNIKKFKGECNHTGSILHSCQTTGDYQTLILNDKFTIEYKACEDIEEIFDQQVEYACLGDWNFDKNHFFAVANMKESRKEEKYRCFVKNDTVIKISTTAECNNYNSSTENSEVLTIKRVNSIIEPGCHLPKHFLGQWITNVDINDDVQINDTHIIETNPFDGKISQTIYICKEKRNDMVLMAKITVEGCPNDYVCFDFSPKKENIIRYKKGRPTIQNSFEAACSARHFENKNQLNYYLKKTPKPIQCPIGGKFSFRQKGDFLFEARYGQTANQHPDIHCKSSRTEICAACDSEKNEISIFSNKCAKPTDVNEKPDFVLKCIAFWKENKKSYLITYDEMDPLYQYHCWVYEGHINSNKILMSQATGSFCTFNQTSNSSNSIEGAAVALELNVLDKDGNIKLFLDDGSSL